MLDVSTRIVVSLFDYLGHKDLSLDHLFIKIEAPNARTILNPESLVLNTSYISQLLFGELLRAFVDVVNNPYWARDFVNYSIARDSSWIVPIRSAAATPTSPFHFYNFIVNWYSKIEFPCIATYMTCDQGVFSVVMSIPDRSGNELIFEILEQLFIQAPKIIGLPESKVTSNSSGNQITFDIRFPNGKSKWSQFAFRLKNLFNSDPQNSTVQNFYLHFASGYENLLNEREEFHRKNLLLESQNLSQANEITHLRGEVCELQAYLEALFENLDAFVFLTDQNGDILAANDQYYEMLNTIALAGHKSVKSTITELSEVVAKVYQTGTKCDSVFSFYQNSTEKTYAIKSTPVYDDPGNIIGCVSVGLDITKQKILDSITSESKKSHEKNSRVRSMFVSSVSHELRTPLTSILGFIELLLEREVPKEKLRVYLGIIKSNSHLLLGLINNLLDIAKIEAGARVIDAVSIDAIRYFDKFRDSISKKVQDKNLEFNFDIGQSVPSQIYSDPGCIKQVLGHLIDNSLKFTDSGFIHVNIEVSEQSSDEQHQYLNIHIRDSGKGVQKPQVGALFSPEYTGDHRISADIPGAGIALGLSQKIAQELGGDISYVDDAEVGTHYVFHLNTGVKTGSKGEDGSQTTLAAKPDLTLTGKRILLMDDIADIQMLYSTILKLAGAQVDVADNGKVGIELANSKSYDIIIVDLKMPEMDGFETTRRLRTNGFKMPIIALTSYARPQERTLSIEAGCNDHISKPVGAGQLIEKVNSWLHQSAFSEFTGGLTSNDGSNQERSGP